MSSFTASARAEAKSILREMGLLPAAQRILGTFRASSSYPEYDRRFRKFKRKYAHVLAAQLNRSRGAQRVALVCSPAFPEVEIELGLIKGLQLAGVVPVVVISYKGDYGRLFVRYYKLAGVNEIYLWDEFTGPIDRAEAEDIVNGCASVKDLLEVEHAGVRVGRLAVSSALRQTYLGSLDLRAPRDRDLVVKSVASGIAYAKAAQRMLQRFHPDLAMFVDTVYSPMGELFDSCLQNGVETIQWQAGHKSNSMVFKRYSLETRLEHPRSLSEESWRLVRNMEWTNRHRESLERELYSSYASGDWYSVVGTQFHKSMIDPERLRERFGLDPNKKAAFIFPHILWDATLFWGKPLFDNYEQWLVETVRAACANDHVNWVIKIHPANRRVRERGSAPAESAEVVSLRKYIGKLPPHIILIPPESEISTYSLFQIMDYCITICGTVGIESARLGIPVITGGSGLYDKKGFTVDSDSREEYIDKLRNIETIERLTSPQRELAERFAYGTFLLRPWQAKSVTLHYLQNTRKFSSQGRVNIRSAEEWYAAKDLRTFADWVTAPNKPADFLAYNMLPIPGDRILEGAMRYHGELTGARSRPEG